MSPCDKRIDCDIIEPHVHYDEILPRRDTINHPPHYTANGIEAIDVIEAFGLGFHLGNVVKYVLRAPWKGSPIEDLKKARWYLDREIQRREKEPDPSAAAAVREVFGSDPRRVPRS